MVYTDYTLALNMRHRHSIEPELWVSLADQKFPKSRFKLAEAYSVPTIKLGAPGQAGHVGGCDLKPVNSGGHRCPEHFIRHAHKIPQPHILSAQERCPSNLYMKSPM